MIKANFVEVIVHMDITTKTCKHVLKHEAAVLEEIYGTVEVVGDIEGSVREVDAESEYNRLAECYGRQDKEDGGRSYVELAFGNFKSGAFEKALKASAPKASKPANKEG